MKKNYTLGIFLLLFLVGLSVEAQNIRQSMTELENQAQASITTNKNFGTAAFVKFPVQEPLSLNGNTLQEKVTQFLETHKAIYNLKTIDRTMAFQDIKTDNYGLKHLVVKQEQNGVPVYGGELRFHFNSTEKLTAINGSFIPPDNKLNVVPTLTKFAVDAIALNAIENQNLNHSGAPLKVEKSTLYVFQKGWVQGYAGAHHLVYEVEVRNNVDVREFIFIDAHSGAVVEQFTGMAHAMDRILYEGDTSVTVWQEGDPFPGALDEWQQSEVETSAHVYHFFNNTFGYASYDGADAQMRTINNNPNVNCPNATWNGFSTNYCTGTASDDVVAHEWGHAYTEYTSRLIYAYQSGAINEAYSDIWGETIDLINNYQDEDEDLSLRTECGSSDRWRMGEDASAFGAPIRDMWNPNCNNHPGRVTDTQYLCGTFDSGGVHINSGIPNHAYALLVDGGAYNGQIINGIGLIKAAHIFWRAQSVYLTRASSFADLADALEASATDLLGIELEGLSTTEIPAGLSGESITMEDVTDVANAILAVEMRVDPNGEDICNYRPILAPTDPVCDASTSNPIFYEDWESGIGDWTVTQIPVNPGTWTPRDWVIEAALPDGRPGTGIYASDPIIGNCNDLLENGIMRLESPVINIPDNDEGIFEMTFAHYIATEPNWDGANIKYSLDGGEWTILPREAFTANPYNGTINSFEGAGNDNPMEGEDAYTGFNPGEPLRRGSWGESTIDLSSLGVVANSTIQFRWEMGSDGCNGLDGWYLDEISIYNCSEVLSVDDPEHPSNNIAIFPNPSNGIFVLQKTSNIELTKAEIYDINGRMLKYIDVSGIQTVQEVNISELPSGIYFVAISTKEARSVSKIIKQ